MRLHALIHCGLKVDQRDRAVCGSQHSQFGHCGGLLDRIVGTGGVLPPTNSAEDADEPIPRSGSEAVEVGDGREDGSLGPGFDQILR